MGLCGLTPGSSTDRSRILSLTAGAPVDVTPSFLTSGAEQLRGVCYGPTDSLWGAVTTDASGASHVYTSPDLVTWTAVSSFPNTVAAGIAVAGNVWALYVFQFAVPHTNRVLVCGGIGATTPVWTPADFTDVNQITSRTNVIGAFLSSGQQLLAAELDNTTLSLASVRISQRGVGA